MIRYILPWPPSVNHYTFRVGTRSVLTPETRSFFTLVRRAVDDQGRQSVVDYPVNVRWIVTRPDKRVRDGSNLLKCLEDGLTKAGVWTDDNFDIIRQTTIGWNGIIKAPGRVIVEITRAENDTDF